MNGVLRILIFIIEAYIVVLIAYALCSWLPSPPDSLVWRIRRFLSALCEPVLRPARRLIPPVRAGGAAIDLSVFIVVLLLVVLSGILRAS